MYTKTTKGVTVTVTPYFLDDQSSPQESHYVWAYQVNIKNSSSNTMKLNHRNWVIINFHPIALVGGTVISAIGFL